MMRAFTRALVFTALLGSGVALAENRDQQGQKEQGQSRGRRRSVPEFDPAAIGAVAAIVAGGGLLIARRRR